MISIAGNYEVDPGTELPAFDQPGCRAYAAEDNRQPDRALFALAIPHHMAPRHDLMRYLMRLGALPLVRPVALGIGSWPSSQEEHLIIVYDQPGGPRLCSDKDPTFKPLREDELQEAIVEPAAAVLKEFNSRGYTHRAIRADNVFYVSSDKSSLMLGDCVALPPAINQPVLYETVEAALANPAGRGPGWIADDLYSLGVLIAMLLSGGKLCEGMSDEQIIQSKIANGSYGALIGRNRLSMPIMELLRGLLCDVTRERWTLKDLVSWTQGRRQTPKQPMLPKKGSRPFEYQDQIFWTAKALSAAAGADWDMALEISQDTVLAGWFRRSLGDGDRAERLQALLRSGLPSASGGPPHRLVAETLIAMEPEAPLRYRDLSLYPEAVAQLLGVEWDQQDRRQRVAEMIRNRLPNAWFDGQKGAGAEHVLLRKSFTSMLQYISQPRLGYGLERVLYEFNPHWPCRSPLLGGAYVYSLLQLLPALERIARENTDDQVREPVDNHIVAFAAARARHLPERVLSSLARHDNLATYRMAILYLFAELQRETAGEPCPAFAGWLSLLTGPIIESYNSAEARQTAARAIKKAADSGNLGDLVAAADNPELRSRDQAGLKAAVKACKDIDEEIAWLESGAMVSDDFVGERAQKFAAVACGCLSSVAFLFMTIYYVGV